MQHLKPGGFAELEVLPSALAVAFVDVQGQELSRYEIAKED